MQLLGDYIWGSFGLDGQTIVHDSGDFLRITIRDDLPGVNKIDYFQASLHGNKVAP